jgi:hypothetical protein
VKLSYGDESYTKVTDQSTFVLLYTFHSYTTDETLQNLAQQLIPDDPQHDPPIPFTLGTISYAGTFCSSYLKTRLRILFSFRVTRIIYFSIRKNVTNDNVLHLWFTTFTNIVKGSGPDSRTSQIFISFMENGGSFGTQLWETPIGRVVEGLDTVVQQFYSGYGDMPPCPDGQSYINDNFSLLDHFLECHVVRKSLHDEIVEPDVDIDVHRELTNGMGDKDHLHSSHIQHSIRSPKHLHQHPHKDHRDGHSNHHNENPNHSSGDGGEEQHKHVEENPEGEQHERIVTAAVGELHHAHTVHFNAAPNEEGLTKLSWELVASCLLLFLAVFMLWLRFALCTPKKIRAARQRKSK